jgi:hypothetical protein
VIVRVPGHAYRPVRNPLSYRCVYPECECGEKLTAWSLPGKDARFVHSEHKRQVLREDLK